MTAKNHTIVIPAYEPDDRMIALLQELNEKSAARLIVVNDGSSKETDSVFRKAEDYAQILTHNKNYGKGKAIKTALDFIQKEGKLQVHRGTPNSELEQLALANEKITQLLADRQVVKVIVVPDRLVNIVAN